MDSDEAFDNFIEVSEEISDDSDTDKENIPQPVKFNRIKNTKKEQFNLISSFVKDHSEESLGRRKFSEQWEFLTTDLNNLGPPTHSTSEWRKIWSEYKYKTTKRELLRKTGEASGKRRNVELNQVVDVRNPLNRGVDVPNQLNRGVDVPNQLNQGVPNQFQSDVVAKFDIIIKQQEKTISLLEELVRASRRND